MSRDTVRIKAAGYIKDVYDSLYFVIEHANLPGAWANNLFFTYATDSLIYFDSETGIQTICTNINPTIVNASTSFLSLNLSDMTHSGGCLYGVNITAGDSIHYIVKGIVRNVARTNWVTIPAFRARFYNVDGGSQKYCNDRGTTFDILGTNYSNYTNADVTPTILEGCMDFNFYAQHINISCLSSTYSGFIHSISFYKFY